ncbi:MAG: anhydro-N-acetylmuramic acid kinase [Porticoccaceae bacterium]|nr:anhydro-N-acetylmuramic acid kinase [Porticoccaceae bacterium]
MTKPNIYVGLMSGTSMDSIDAVAIDFQNSHIQMIGSHSHPIPNTLKQDILALCQPGVDNIDLYGRTDRALGHLFSDATLALLEKTNINTKQVIAIGSHGQTIRHQPPEKSHGFTLQIGDPNIIAIKTKCAVVADFRRADMALGGQGAPLVPAFHHHYFADPRKHRIILNIGGIANITVLKNNTCSGFDTGPGNLLLDSWCLKNTGQPFDDKGAWADTGNLSRALVDQLKLHPFFELEPPKSTGREVFNASWLEQQLTGHTLPAEDIQASLIAFSVETISEAIARIGEPVDDILVCGGGAFNTALITALEKNVAPYGQPNVSSTSALRVDPEWVEACAFAWLAKQRIELKTANIPSVTGASRATVLGALYHF